MKNTYHALSNIGFLSQRYTSKFLFVAFLGIHVPLIVVAIFVGTGIVQMSPLNIILLTLFATLIATAITLLVLNGLLWPLHLGRNALDAYLTKNEQPLLPVHYKDEAGLLLARVQETIEKLDMLMEDKKDLISLFSHDMRTPTSQLVTLAALIKKEKDVVKLKEYTAVMEQAAGKQMNLLNNVLNMLTADHHYSTERNFECFPLKHWLEECLHDLEVTAKQKNISFDIHIDRMDCSVCGDRPMLTEALHNVLTNAIKFSYANSSIVVKGLSLPHSCRIDIIDSGLGFKPETSRKLFDKFTKYGKDGTAGEHSTGLGLYLSRNILRKHNGTIKAFSEGEGKGATFSIEIPCQ